MSVNVRDVQHLLAHANYYSGAIDGDAGPLTMRAVELIEQHDALVRSAGWPKRRRLVAAAQRVLRAGGYEPGHVDGYWGHNTDEAFTAFLSGRLGTVATVDRTPLARLGAHEAQAETPRQRDVPTFYGVPGGPACTAGKVELPVPFVIAWNQAQRVTRFSCHERVAIPLTAIFREAVRHYGAERFSDLDLDVFGGCFNHRRMRGGTSWSMHSWGIAVDLNPANNQLRWGADQAQFAGSAYTAFWNICEAHGATVAGRAWGKDWMHFQFARL